MVFVEIGSVIFVIFLIGYYMDIMYIIECVLIINDIIKSYVCSVVVVFVYIVIIDRICIVSRIGVVMICFVVIVNV